MNLIYPIVINCVLVCAFYLAEKYTPSKKLPYISKQIIIGVIFGALSAFASSCGVEWFGTIVNVRDAAPLSAGLIFGAPAGIISGFIGGIYRYVSVAWGAGTYTQLACSIATVLAGLMAAGLRKLMFDNKKPTWGYAICITVVCEVIHMLLIFLTNMDDSAYAFEFVRGATFPMVIGNSIAVGTSVIIVTLLSHEKLKRRKGSEHIAQTFQRWLLVCVVIAFMITSTYTYFLHNGIVQLDTEKIFTTAVKDIAADVRQKSDEHLIKEAKKIAEYIKNNPEEKLTAISREFGVIEINIVDETGLIVKSTDKKLEGLFNMNSTDQSREFMSLLGEKTECVQEYGPVGSDGVTMRKFAGVSLEEGGFLQVGYSAQQFHLMINEFVKDVTKNRHVGSSGFIIVCDEELKLVTDNRYNGMHVSVLGVEPDETMLKGEAASQLYKGNLVNAEKGYTKDYIYVFTFVEGYCIIATLPEEEAMLMRDASLYTSVFMQVIIFATLFVFIYVLIKRVIINNLKKINSTLAQITNGNLELTVDVRTNAEFASLSDDINLTVSALKRYIAEAAARIDKELEYAKQIQLSALPTNFPEDEAWEVYASMIAAKEVGGDFYDFYKLSDDTVAFLVADVSGKGIPAAMFMMTAKTIIKDLAERGLPVDEIFTRANEKLCENNESGMFVTAWMGILDIRSGKLTFANAGHNPPLLKRADGSFEYLRSRAGFVLAGMDGLRYRVNELDFKPGDRIFLYTDGVTEATNTENELYGEDRLATYMNRFSAVCATELLSGLKADIDEFVGEAPQFDDITMLMFDFKPKKGDVKPMKKSFPASTEALDEVMAFLEEALESIDCPMKAANLISVAIEEVFVNVAHYAYGESEGEASLEILFNEESREATFVLSDSGVPFDPLRKPDPDITLSAEDRQIGGLGIFITKKTMDSVSYAYENGKNILTMNKKI